MSVFCSLIQLGQIAQKMVDGVLSQYSEIAIEPSKENCFYEEAMTYLPWKNYFNSFSATWENSSIYGFSTRSEKIQKKNTNYLKKRQWK